MEPYGKIHESRGDYVGGSGVFHENKLGWTDVEIGENMIFSHRKTAYTRETFREGMHTHDYHELILYIGGDVEYIVGNTVFRPISGCIICVPPGVMHTARLRSASVYERFVLYFYPSFFEFMRKTVPFPLPPTEFLPSDTRYEKILTEAEKALKDGEKSGILLSQAHIITLFGFLSAAEIKPCGFGTLTGEVAEVKRYIDENFASIHTISEVAAHFFYSREHLSRCFREHFNVSPSEYLVQKRIAESLALLRERSVAEVCYCVGFGNQTSFISAFRRIMGCLPSEYKKKRLQKDSVDRAL